MRAIRNHPSTGLMQSQDRLELIANSELTNSSNPTNPFLAELGIETERETRAVMSMPRATRAGNNALGVARDLHPGASPRPLRCCGSLGLHFTIEESHNHY
jgi:hypothetical protein